MNEGEKLKQSFYDFGVSDDNILNIYKEMEDKYQEKGCKLEDYELTNIISKYTNENWQATPLTYEMLGLVERQDI